MSRFTHIVAQVGTFLADMIAQGVVTDPQWSAWLYMANLAISGLLGVIAHSFNPDGTDARTAYVPEAPPRPPVLPLIAILCLCILPPMDAQSRVTAEQQRGPVSSAGLVFVILPDGRVAAATLGPGITIDTSSAEQPILRVTSIAPPVPFLDRLQAMGPVPIWDLSQVPNCPPAPTQCGAGLLIYRNGLFQSEGIDYTQSGRRVTWLFQPGAGDHLTAIYR